MELELPKASILPQKDPKDKTGKTYILPVTDGAKADLLYNTTKARLLLQKQVEEYDKLESQIENYFIEKLPVSNATGLAGKVARVQVKPREIPTAEDWPSIHKYILKNKSFDLLQRRLNESAIKERWENKIRIPGVGKFIAKKVSCTKL